MTFRAAQVWDRDLAIQFYGAAGTSTAARAGLVVVIDGLALANR